MDSSYTNFEKYGSLIAEIHGKVSSMLQQSDYESLEQCETVEDMVVRLSHTSYASYLSEELQFNKKEFLKRLNKSFYNEFMYMYRNSENDLKLLLNYFIEVIKIQNFIFLLASKSEDPDLKCMEEIDMLGNFNELDAIKISADMSDVYKFCVESTFLKKYYDKVYIEKEFAKNDWQIIQSTFFKNHIENFYDQINNLDTMDYMKEILKYEGDRKIIELTINTLDSVDIVDKKRIDLYPTVCSFDRGSICKMSECTSMESIRDVLCGHPMYKKIVMYEDNDFMKNLFDLEIKNYLSSLSEFNDLSCAYCYFKLKEREIKNIMWIAECISHENKEGMKDVMVIEN
ncbi:subunit d of V-type proton ATPase [Hamiltosporidium magnivora]|uniref:Subunit d of V-type proton ATPase n=1 Tax=Hamiltosporidium magnivora TaxID=148818 RepID=A0A4Q9L181_9MICR|nr:subunit d of V-type proton ATPase [Hamiltosporidium magnivora]TBU08304.1 subunit d of V-type proton ATPase [Hamiltosporidium magnivora]